MTRINVGIPPKELSYKHLLAEHREIKRIPNCIKKGKCNFDNIPEQFTLGTGHVKFFYNKIGYLRRRYVQIYLECKKRGYNVQFYGDAFKGISDTLNNNYSPTTRDIQIIRQRILERS